MKSLALALAATASLGLVGAMTNPTPADAQPAKDAFEFAEAPVQTMDQALAAASTTARLVDTMADQLGTTDLAPGDYAWLDANAVNGRTEIVVDLSEQKAFVTKGGILVGVSTISSGKPGHETPTGTFEILEKNVEHYSNLYDDASMPYMQRLTWDGVALHAGRIPGYPASHGCIRLPHEFAEQLFGETGIGTRVTVTS
ncbi:L,D-transpeptidase family protein [Sphingomicrobium nitratireducens]|uniref:L,D-transpeptidase family protein n=1 Tax=Sphingomicrobium nitratireducens TaxID=2964666 RepID=UPI0030B87EBB